MKVITITMFTLMTLVLVAWAIVANAEEIHYVRMKFSDEFDLGRKTQTFIAEDKIDTCIVEQIGGGYLGNDEHYRKVARGEAPPMPIDTLYYECGITTRELIGVTHPNPYVAIIWYRELKSARLIFIAKEESR